MTWLTRDQVMGIIARYPNEKAAIIAADYNVSAGKIYSTAKRYGVKKSPDFNNSLQSGRIQNGQRLSVSTEFKPGNVPCFISRKTIKRDHLWKKGQKPHTTAKDGEIRYRKNPGFYFIRISDNNWEFLHRYLWRTQVGPIPEGYNVVFKDGNHRNCTIENLECISDEELVARNTIHRYPKEIVELIHLKQSIYKHIKKLSKQ